MAARPAGDTDVILIREEWKVNSVPGCLPSNRGNSVSTVVFELGTISPTR
jgi:hypothetical protein